MPFPIDASRAFRFPSELQRLAAAVRDAGDYDETRWIEWKSNLDLRSPHGRVHLIKQILGFANRDPQVAAQWAQGHAYLLVGVSPGSVKGVTAVDHQTLLQDLSPYVGSDVLWSPEYVELDGARVLVVVVAPPRPGDLIHFLRKDLPHPKDQSVLHPEGTIFIRRHAETKRANHDERLMLQQRIRASADILEDVAVLSRHPAVESTPITRSQLQEVVAEGRDRLLAARYEPDAESMAHSMLGQSSPDPRTHEQYVAEVDAYLKDLLQAYQTRLEAELAEHEPAGLGLSVRNGTSRSFLGLQLSVTVRGAEIGVLEPEVSASGPMKLPDEPVPFGTPRSTFLWSGEASWLSSNVIWPIEPRRTWEARQLPDGIQVVFDPVDLRPETTVELEQVPLWVEAEPGTKLTVTWRAAATSASGVIEGQFSLDVAASTLSPFASAFQDGPDAGT